MMVTSNSHVILQNAISQSGLLDNHTPAQRVKLALVSEQGCQLLTLSSPTICLYSEAVFCCVNYYIMYIVRILKMIQLLIKIESKLSNCHCVRDNWLLREPCRSTISIEVLNVHCVQTLKFIPFAETPEFSVERCFGSEQIYGG